MQAFLDEVGRALGARGLTTDPQLIDPWLTDWRGRWRGAAAGLASPASTDEVVVVVRAAARHRVALVPQGGNTSMVGGATPAAEGGAVILSLRRMTRIRALDAEAGTAVAEAGVILADLDAAAREQARRFPLTLGARGTATIGGLVSTNAGGTQVLRWGTMRGLVAGVEAVLPDGQVYDGLAALKKDNRGYDLSQLLIGAEGTLGVVTAATLRLAPAIAARSAAWIGLASPKDALTLLRRLQRSTDAVESFELMPAEYVEAVVAHDPGARAPMPASAPWQVLVEAVATDLAGESPAALLERLLASALEDGLITDAVIAASEAQVDAFWRLRDGFSAGLRALGPATQHDISVPVDRMPAFLADGAAGVERRFPGTRANGFGHLGDGNVHFHVHAPSGVDAQRWYAEDAPLVTRFVHDLVTAADGSISAEHGIGQMKRDELERLGGDARMTALRAIKGALDPLGIMNPGKLVAPLAPAQPAS